MDKLFILCVDDERDVLDSVMRDLQSLESFCHLEAAESVAEAREVVQDYEQESQPLALILCDHIMPEQTGVDYLIELHQQPSTQATKKILLTGQADLNDTVSAVNHHCLDHYIAKPWQKETLIETVRSHLTDYVIAQYEDPMPWAQYLDTNKILQALASQRHQFGE